ncbi:MAG TPA: hypothetical protein VF498_09730, partial [Anaerolineales bacterium]
MDEDTLSLYQDLIQIYLREPACRDDLLEIASDPSAYPAHMAEIEQWLDRSQNDQPAEGAALALAEGCCKDLFDRVVTSEPLLAVFRREPRLSGRDPGLVVAMGSLADIHPDPQTTFQSGDRMFMRILPKAVLNLPLSADEILKADFSKLVRLKEISPAAFEELVKLAQAMPWKNLAALESFLGEVSSAQRSTPIGNGNGAQGLNAAPSPASASGESS